MTLSVEIMPKPWLKLFTQNVEKYAQLFSQKDLRIQVSIEFPLCVLLLKASDDENDERILEK